MGKFRLEMNHHKVIDTIFKKIFLFAAIISASMIAFILLFIIKKGTSVFMPYYPERVHLFKFLSGFSWDKNYGVLFILLNTLITSFTALLIVTPIAVLTALFIAKVAPSCIQNMLTTMVELLAAVPSVVYGVFASGLIVKGVDHLASLFHMTTFGGRSSLAVSLILAMMIFPTITSLSVVAIRGVDPKLEQASLALGATRTETYFKVVLKSAKSGIFSGIILGMARAFGEATAVSMVAGNKSIGPTLNPFDITRTLTSTMLSGLNETTGVDYDIRYSVGIVLMFTILCSNFLLIYIKKRMGGEIDE